MFSWQYHAEQRPSENDAGLAFDRSLARARQGEAEGISDLYRRFLPMIFAYVAARVADRQIAEDLTSDVFLQMVEGISRVRAKNEASFVAWLLQITRSTVAGYYRKHKNAPMQISISSPFEDNEQDRDVVDHATIDPGQWAETREEWRTVVDAMNQLTEEQRQVLIGRLILGYDVATVARMIGKKANAIKALQFRALRSLQRLLAQPSRQVTSTRTHAQSGKGAL